MLLSLGQRMLNEQIAASTAARERIAGLEGKRFAVVLKGSDFRVVAHARDGGLSLEMSQVSPCDVELTAGLFDLLRLARSASLSDLREVGASLNGDIDVAERFADLMRFAMPDPESLLADWVGDIPAHAAGEAARHVGGWTARAQSALEQNTSEYLQEENATLLPPPMAKRFGAEVDRIRDDVDRAVRRVEMLERQLAAYRR